jgi:hypothetical protein
MLGLLNRQRASEETSMSTKQQSMNSFERLIGKWKLTGEVSGTVEYKWAEGEHFLIQEVDMEFAGRTIRGIEFIGHIAKPGKPKPSEVRSRFYSFLDGLALDYIYEMEGNTFRICFEDKSLNNFMLAEISQDGRKFVGAWQWPGGGYAFQTDRITQ